MFTGTIRENLDPDNQYTDDILWNIISKIGIRELIPSLETTVENSGSSFSAGQKQLICLARAAITKCKILVLDEATANMDAETDRLLHCVIEEMFPACTVLMIAHKLHLIVKCDKVLVLDNGNIVEFDEPKSLLSRESSLFHQMCQDLKID